MNLKEIKEIVNLMNDNELTEIEVEREGVKLKIKKIFGGIPGGMMQPAGQYQVETSPAQNAPAAVSVDAKAASRSLGKPITSPMVGTFYRAPSPEAPPFVELGQMVEVGQVVCIVEAMKLMNEIKSEIKGKIVSIAVENAEPVEFGQTLFEVEPA